MPRTFLIALLSLSCASQAAQSQATQLDLQLSSQLWPQPNAYTAQIGLSELPLGPGQFSASFSNRAATVGYRQSLSLPPLGALDSQTELARPWRGGLRLSSSASGSLGPVALQVRGEAFSAPLSVIHPFDQWQETPRDLRPQGWNLNMDGRYRLDRRRIIGVGLETGEQTSVTAGLELRPTPPQPSENDEETSSTPLNLSYRAGLRAGQSVFGVTAGLTLSNEQGLEWRTDALAGTQFGITSRLTLPPVGDTDFAFYLAYEPWRQTSAPLRYGAELSRPLGRGTVQIAARGGQLHGGPVGGGFEVRYSLPLNADDGQP